MRVYAGIGSRKSTPQVNATCALTAEELEEQGWFLRSGHADGCDVSFEMGVNKAMEIHLPWSGYNNAHHGWPYIVPKATPEVAQIAAAHHPVWSRLSDPVKLLMCRNVTIILGPELEKPAEMVICWTPDGGASGGTGHGIRVANAYGIPVFNFALKEDQERLCQFVT